MLAALLNITSDAHADHGYCTIRAFGANTNGDIFRFDFDVIEVSTGDATGSVMHVFLPNEEYYGRGFPHGVLNGNIEAAFCLFNGVTTIDIFGKGTWVGEEVEFRVSATDALGGDSYSIEIFDNSGNSIAISSGPVVRGDIEDITSP